MTDLRTAAQQALEALESLFTLQVDDARPKRCGDAIAALRAALEQPERAQAMRDAGYTRRPTLREMADPEQPEQEPVAWRLPDPDPEGRFEWVLYQTADFMPGVNPMEHFDGLEPLFTHPPRREWRGLTEEEISVLFPSHLRGDYKDLIPYSFARAIEAALKERNT